VLGAKTAHPHRLTHLALDLSVLPALQNPCTRHSDCTMNSTRSPGELGQAVVPPPHRNKEQLSPVLLLLLDRDELAASSSQFV
jgi:hypothetical protein